MNKVISTHLDTDLLRTFVAIADTGGFTPAAQVVHRSQSAVSMQMKKLEEIIDRPLFEKRGRGVILTLDGETLLSYARRILKLQEEAVTTLRQPDITGSVRIGIPDDYVSRFLPGILTRFANSYPLVQLEVLCEPSGKLTPSIKRGDIDLGIVTALPDSIEGEILRRETTVWATSRSHQVHEQRPLPLVLFQKGCIFRDWSIKTLDKLGIPYRIAYSSPSITGVEAIVGAGLGVTVLARSILSDQMRELTVQDGFPDLPESVISLLRSPRSRSPATDCLANHIIDGFRNEPAPIGSYIA
ncbi:MAG: LysR family transcriptional regulator [Gammaproteobacteria bacterium]|nr:LysR family transcriptional regulator [Gammaproteobacteria bacterium]